MPDVQISSPSLSILPGAAYPRRDGVADGARRPVVDAVAERTGEPARGAVSRVRSLGDAGFDSLGLDESLQNLPARNRNALRSYLDNGPTIQERLGVELAGVDVFA